MNNDIRDSLRKAYNGKAQERDGNAIHEWKLEERKIFLSLLREEKKETLLEIGAGSGKDSAFFQEQGLKVLCTDLSPEMIKLCQAKGLDAKILDFANLGSLNKSFDAVYALSSLLHLPKKELPAVLTLINARLNPKGLFFMGVYGGHDSEGIWDEDSYRPKRFFSFFDDAHIKNLVSKIFDIVSFKRITIEEITSSGLHYQSVILRKRK
ncbi:MAG: class I SAM-dependent methyltransferase [Anaerolineae bacterium]|jgi:cyclopropane fatty-acyl-phospholipid synthase-like methyltransferase|nr:class I SAM-dependent methyltransferase [Anaerolineae bacterium]MBT7191503.1 class I SAM-dependent methyltransferase [Anaerolineae bacterium]MBT7989910.1 class I SAM-dependent methyltransferase [Anaerolineae bacterium]